MQKLIIDVSEHQGKIGWSAVKLYIDGAIIRCGYGDDDVSQDDKQWTRNVSECEHLGIPYGVYLYSYADTMEHAKSEVAHVERLLKGHRPQYPVYFDTEQSGCESLSRKASEYFCEQITKAGYTAGVYTYESWYNAYLRGFDKYSLWIAAYGVNDGKPHNKPNVGAEIDGWQYTSMGRIGGYSGRLDVSYFYKTWTAAKPAPETSTTGGSAAKVLEIAASQIGVTDGTKYGRWYEQNVDKNSANYDFGANDVPWCAMFVSWVFAQAGAKCAGLPGAYCPSMLQAAANANKVVTKVNAKPGDVVYFDWDGGVCDHVGIVESNDGANLSTIEGNTDDGIVARKIRPYSYVAGVVRPDYAKTSTTPSSSSKPKKLVVDGIMGVLTISELQRQLGVNVTGKMDKTTVKALQKALNAGRLKK